jgi:hypothetical protein
MKRWKVSYECIEDKRLRYPFWKRSQVVEAPNREAAKKQIMAQWPPPRYGRYRASPCTT